MAAPGSGATESERITAQSLVGKLMRRYGVREAQLSERDRITIVLSTWAGATFTWGFAR